MDEQSRQIQCRSFCPYNVANTGHDGYIVGATVVAEPIQSQYLERANEHTECLPAIGLAKTAVIVTEVVWAEGEESKPNIFFIFTDGQRFEAVGAVDEAIQ